MRGRGGVLSGTFVARGTSCRAVQLCGYAFVGFLIIGKLGKPWQISTLLHVLCCLELRHLEVGPHLTNGSFLSARASSTDNNNTTTWTHGATYLQGCKRASSRAIGCQDVIRWTRTHHQGLSRCLCFPPRALVFLKPRLERGCKIAVEPEPCILRGCTPSVLPSPQPVPTSRIFRSSDTRCDGTAG